MTIIINSGRDEPRPEKEKKKFVIRNKYDHQLILHHFLKAISMCPMDAELKQILRMRIWGKEPNVFKPMSRKRIAMELKTKEINVKRWEEDALYNLEQFLDRKGIVTISEKFLKEGNLKKIMGEKTKVVI